MAMQEGLVRSYYDKRVEKEWQRLEQHRMKFSVTKRLLSTYLPPSGRILDCGGGPGRYALWLASQGYDVTLFDLSASCLAKARTEASAAGVKLSYEQGTATDLSYFADDSFDAVLVMGPLYHLVELGDRQTALAEAVRIVKSPGLVATSFITRTAALRYFAKELANEVLVFYAPMLNVIDEGYDQTVAPGIDYFPAYFAHPNEVEPLLRGAGLEPLGVFAVEGFVSMIDETINTLQGAEWEAWVELNLKLAADPTLFSGAEHLLAFGKKNGG
jgi:2-polyprenyl-3-methyl-5-hydroxy-6-metoxy-1,4-benzoquinol methylase